MVPGICGPDLLKTVRKHLTVGGVNANVWVYRGHLPDRTEDKRATVDRRRSNHKEDRSPPRDLAQDSGEASCPHHREARNPAATMAIAAGAHPGRQRARRC